MNHRKAIEAAKAAQIRGVVDPLWTERVIRAYLAGRNEDNSLPPPNTLGHEMMWVDKGGNVLRPVLVDECAWVLLADFGDDT